MVIRAFLGSEVLDLDQVLDHSALHTKGSSVITASDRSLGPMGLSVQDPWQSPGMLSMECIP